MDTLGALNGAAEKMSILVDGFITALQNIPNDSGARTALEGKVNEYAKKIWKRAVAFVQNGNPDDRPLYWARLKMEVALKSHPFVLQSTFDSEKLVELFENKSRNYDGIDFSEASSGMKKVLLTGFDPFQLKNNPTQRNPSGIAALALHGKTITIGQNSGLIQAALFPVRYFDFDRGCVEKVIEDFLLSDTDDNINRKIISLSLNGGYYWFDLERFAGKNRGGFEDNLNIGSANKNLFIQLRTSEYGDEFYETELPAEAIITNILTFNFDISKQRHFYDQSYVAGNHRDHIKFDHSQPNTNIDSFPISEIVGNSNSGSGGHYLSNEIMYRIARLREKHSSLVKTGHFHIANPSPSLPPPLGVLAFTLNGIIDEVENAIKRSL